MMMIFHIHVFIYIIHPHTKNFNYVDPRLCIMTYERIAMNVIIYPKSKVKDELIIKSKTCGNGIFCVMMIMKDSKIKIINTTHWKLMNTIWEFPTNDGMTILNVQGLTSMVVNFFRKSSLLLDPSFSKQLVDLNSYPYL